MAQRRVERDQYGWSGVEARQIWPAHPTVPAEGRAMGGPAWRPVDRGQRADQGLSGPEVRSAFRLYSIWSCHSAAICLRRTGALGARQGPLFFGDGAHGAREQYRDDHPWLAAIRE